MINCVKIWLVFKYGVVWCLTKLQDSKAENSTKWWHTSHHLLPENTDVMLKLSDGVLQQARVWLTDVQKRKRVVDPETDTTTHHSSNRTQRKRIYIVPLLKYLTLKALRYGSHSVTCKLHRTCLCLVSIHQMAHPRLRLPTSNCSLLLIYLPRKDERLSWPGWLVT